jgi:hypothetical protein
MTGDCRDCRDWRGCPGKEWYSYSDICWCAQQNFWLLKYAKILQGGDWPTPEIMADPSIRGKKARTDAGFVRAVLAIGEVNKRLTQTGWRGRLLAEQCINRETIFDLDYDIREVLYYISGWSRKETDFNVWRAVKRYRKYNKVAA